MIAAAVCVCVHASREQVNGQKKHTAIHSNTTSCVFDEVLFFNLPQQSVPDLQKEIIEVAVYDSNHVTRNSLIGLYEFDLLSVYYNPGHEVRAATHCRAPALLQTILRGSFCRDVVYVWSVECERCLTRVHSCSGNGSPLSTRSRSRTRACRAT